MKKITQAHIAALMASVTYHVYAIEDTTTTIAVAFDANGFSLATGMSACADPAIYDAEKGKQFALEDAEKKAEQKLWELEGYKLKCQLAEQESGLAPTNDFRVRLFAERNDLTEKLNELNAFVSTEAFGGLSHVDKSDLLSLREHMKSYLAVLNRRVSRLCNNA